jgi:hypothetical protein
MTWTYSGDPSQSDRDAVRVRVGDINQSDQLLQDEVIDYFIAQYTGGSNIALRASIDAARAIAAYFARESTYRIGQVSETLSRKSEAYERTAKELTRELRQLAVVSAKSVAIKTADKATQEADTTLVQPYFRRGMHDNT